MPYSNCNMSCGCNKDLNKAICGCSNGNIGINSMSQNYMPYQYYGYPYMKNMPYGRKDERFFPLVPFALGLAGGSLLFRPRPVVYYPPVPAYNYNPYYTSNNYY